LFHHFAGCRRSSTEPRRRSKRYRRGPHEHRDDDGAFEDRREAHAAFGPDFGVISNDNTRPTHTEIFMTSPLLSLRWFHKSLFAVVGMAIVACAHAAAAQSMAPDALVKHVTEDVMGTIKS